MKQLLIPFFGFIFFASVVLINVKFHEFVKTSTTTLKAIEKELHYKDSIIIEKDNLILEQTEEILYQNYKLLVLDSIIDEKNSSLSGYKNIPDTPDGLPRDPGVYADTILYKRFRSNQSKH